MSYRVDTARPIHDYFDISTGGHRRSLRLLYIGSIFIVYYTDNWLHVFNSVQSIIKYFKTTHNFLSIGAYTREICTKRPNNDSC